jgi:hypothetical protein
MVLQVCLFLSIHYTLEFELWGYLERNLLGVFLQLMEQIKSRALSKLSRVLLESLQLRNTY